MRGGFINSLHPESDAFLQKLLLIGGTLKAARTFFSRRAKEKKGLGWIDK